MAEQAVKQRIPLREAETLAEECIDLLRPYCERIEIAGSIRRRRPDVGDIEILCIPKIRNDGAADLFGDIPAEVNLLDERVTQLLITGEFGRRLDKNGHGAVGSRYKRLTYRDFGLDLFVCLPPAQWGVLMTIRTGPAEFSHRLVTSTRAGGMLPAWSVVRDGAIWDNGHLVACPEEADVFRFIGLDWIEPAARA